MKKWMILSLTVILTLGFTNLVLAAWPTNMEGEPVALLQQHLEGYFIWHDGSGIHLKVAAANGLKHTFTGIIETDGRIENVMSKTSDSSDYSRLFYHDTLKFQLSASDQISAIDFNIWDGRYVRFELSMDGQKIDTNKIYFGSDGWHPNNSIFTIDYDDEPRIHEHIIFNWWWPWPVFGPHPGPRPRWH